MKGHGLWQIPRGSGRAALAILLLHASGCGGVRTGDSAPRFSLPDASGKSVSLSQHLGKVVLVSFWATWCGPCRTELPELGRLQAELGDEVVLLLVSDEPAETTGPFLAEQGIVAVSLVDADHEVFDSYSISGIPALFVLDRRGFVKETFRGYRPGQTEQVKRSVVALLRS